MTKVYLYITLYILTVSSCSLFEEPEQLTIVNIGTDYFVELSQTLQSGTNPLLLNVTSIEQNNCKDSYIDIQSNLIGRQINLTLGEIISPSQCAKTDHQLSSDVEFELQESDYNINISLKDIVQNHGHIMVSDEKFTIELETENGITIGQQTINIIPDGYVWGSISANDIRNVESIKNLISDLEAQHLPHNLNNGNYSYFEVKDGKVSILDTQEEGTYFEHFLLKQEGFFKDFRQELVFFSEENPNISMSVFDSVGNSYTF